MGETVNVTLAQQTTTLKQQFHNFDKTVRDMFESLDSALELLEEPRMSLNEKFDIVISAEYLIVRVRAKILSELSKVQAVMSAPSTNTTLDKLFKDRYNNIIVLCQRINELRDDFATIQRSMYARNMGRM